MSISRLTNNQLKFTSNGIDTNVKLMSTTTNELSVTGSTGYNLYSKLKNTFVDTDTWKANVYLVSTTDITLSGLQTIDALSLQEGTRILVAGQTLPVENGIYNASASSWTRTIDLYTDMDASGIMINIRRGPNANTVWQCTSVPAIVDTDGLVFTLYSSPIVNKIIVQQDPGTGEFSSIAAAVDSITDATEYNRYEVSVGPGIFVEPQINIPSYVAIVGSSINITVIVPAVANQYLVNMSNLTEISFLSLQGTDGSLSPGPGAGYSAIYCEDVGDFAQMHKISIYDFDIGIDNYSNIADSYLYSEYTDINGDYSYAVRNRSNPVTNGSVAFVNLENFYGYASGSSTKTTVLNDGITATLEMLACNVQGSGAGAKGIVAQNGGVLGIMSVKFEDFLGTAITVNNTGAGPIIQIDACAFQNCVLDFNILNAGTTGYFFGTSPKNNHYIVDGSTFYVANNDSNVIRVAKRGGDYTSIKTAVDSITDSSYTNPYVVSVGPGVFVESMITLKEGVYVIGSSMGATIIVPTASTGTICTGVDGSMLKNVQLTGAYGSGGRAVYFEGTDGSNFVVRDCGFGTNETNVEIYGNGVPTNIVIDRFAFTGQNKNCFRAHNDNVTLTKLVLVTGVYNDTTLPACDNFILATGTGVTVNAEAIIARVPQNTTSTALSINNGVELKLVGSSFTGFGKGLYIPAGSTNPCIANASGVLLLDSLNYDIDILNSNTVGSWVGETQYLKTNIPLDCSFNVYGKNIRTVNVDISGGDFTSVAMAIANITANSSLNRFIINVGAGTYTEPEIVMKPYVSIHGSGRSTVIQPDTISHHIIKGSDHAEIISFIVTGAGTGYAAIYQESSSGTASTGLICRDILLDVNDIQVWSYGNIGHANIILFNSRFGGTSQFNYGFRATNNSNTIGSTITVIGSTSQDFTSPLPQQLCYASGENCSITVNSFNAIYKGTPTTGTVAFQVSNSGHINLGSVYIGGFDTAIYAENSGSAPGIIAVGTSISNCNNDIDIEHPDTTGSIDASATRLKTTVNPSAPISVFIVDPADTGIAFAGPFYYSKNTFNNITDISQLITDAPTMGVMYGGILATNGGLSVAISEGFGYQETGTEPNENHLYRTWTNTTLSVSANSNVYVYMDESGSWTSNSSYPDTTSNILLGLVSTNATGIIYIQATPLSSTHYDNELALMLKNAIGPVFNSGSSVAELGTRQLTVTQGIYYFTNLQFLPGGASPATFDIYYRSTSAGIFSVIAGQTTVPNTLYDDGSGTLASLTAGYSTKHLLSLVGGPNEKYALIYGQAQYTTSGQAEAAGLPIVPSFIMDSFVNVASIVVQQGNANIVSLIDERPRIGFASSSVTGAITVHGDLLGLAANDHPQYLLRDGTLVMTGSLNMNSNNITNAGTINSVTIQTHASRHAFNGADPLDPALTGDLVEISDSTNAAGTNNTKIPRADHVHAHGNRGGGSLHATATTSSAGFISASNQLKLDGIEAGATYTPVSTTAPLNVSKSTALAGTSSFVAREDHKHNIDTAAPSFILLTSSLNLEGTSASLSRADHSHSISSAVPVTQTPDQANAIGNASSFAVSDHIHNIPTAIAVGLDANSSNAQGAASTFARSNHSHAIASGVPSNQTIAAAVSAGTSTNFARADHIHTFSTAVPVTIGIANTEGVSTSFARADHIHSHGNQLGGSLHALVTQQTAGFMSTADKIFIDNLNGALSASSNSITTGSLFATGAIYSGSLSTGSLGVSGPSTLQGLSITNLNASGAVSTNSLTTGTISVSGSTVLQGISATSLNLSGALSIAAISTGTLDVSGPTTLQVLSISALNASGVASIASVTTGTLNVSGPSVLQVVSTSALNVSGAASTASLTTGILNVSGSSVLQGISATSLNLSGVLNIANISTGSVSASGPSVFQAISTTTINASGAVSAVSLTTETLNVSGSTVLQVISTTALNASGAISALSLTTGTLNVSGSTVLQVISITALNASSAISALSLTTGTLNVSGSTVLQVISITALNASSAISSLSLTTGTLNVSGSSVLQGLTITNLRAVGTISSLSLTTGTLNVSGSTVLQGLTISNLRATGAISALSLTTGTLDVSGSSTLQDLSTSILNATSVTTGTLSVSGPTILQVLSTSVLNASSVTTGTLNASGSSVLQGISATTLNLSGAISISAISTGTLSVSGSTVLQAVSTTVLNSTSITTGSINASGPSVFQGLTSSVFKVTGSATINLITMNTLNVAGNSVLQAVSTTTINASGAVSAASLTTGTLNVSGSTILQGLTIANLQANGAISALSISTGTLNLSGPSIFQDITATNINLLGTLSLASISTGTLNISGSSILQGLSATVLNATSITTGTLNVSGSSILQGLSTGILNATSVTTGTLNVSGPSILQGLSTGILNATSVTTGTLNVSGPSILQGLSTTVLNATSVTTGTINVSGSSILQGLSTAALNATIVTTGTLNVSGSSILQGLTITNLRAIGTISSLSVTTGILNVSGSSILQAVSATTLNLSGALSIASISTGTLNVAGSSILQSVSTAVLNATSITTGSLNVSGLSVFQDITVTNMNAIGTISALSITSSTLNISGATIIQGTSLSVLRASGAVNSASVTTGALDVSGSTNLQVTTISRLYANGGVASTSRTTGTIIINGGVGASGRMYATQFNTTSDERFKTNVKLIENPIDIVNSVNGYTYNWINTYDSYTPEKQYGFIAQQLERVGLGNIVSGTDYKSVNYDSMIPILLESVKELNINVEYLNKRVETLEEELRNK